MLRSYYLVTTVTRVIVNDGLGKEGKWKCLADLDVKIFLSLNDTDVLTIH